MARTEFPDQGSFVGYFPSGSPTAPTQTSFVGFVTVGEKDSQIRETAQTVKAAQKEFTTDQAEKGTFKGRFISWLRTIVSFPFPSITEHPIDDVRTRFEILKQKLSSSSRNTPKAYTDISEQGSQLVDLSREIGKYKEGKKFNLSKFQGKETSTTQQPCTLEYVLTYFSAQIDDIVEKNPIQAFNLLTKISNILKDFQLERVWKFLHRILNHVSIEFYTVKSS